MSVTPLVSPATRFDESDSKAMTFPSADTAGAALAADAKPDASPPATGTLARVTLDGMLAPTWATKMSMAPLKSSPTRLPAADSKTTHRPSGLIDGLIAPVRAGRPVPISWLMSWGVPAFPVPNQAISPLMARSLNRDADWKAIIEPSALSDGRIDGFGGLLVQAADWQSAIRLPAPAVLPTPTL